MATCAVANLLKKKATHLLKHMLKKREVPRNGNMLTRNMLQKRKVLRYGNLPKVPTNLVKKRKLKVELAGVAKVTKTKTTAAERR